MLPIIVAGAVASSVRYCRRGSSADPLETGFPPRCQASGAPGRASRGRCGYPPGVRVRNGSCCRGARRGCVQGRRPKSPCRCKHSPRGGNVGLLHGGHEKASDVRHVDEIAALPAIAVDDEILPVDRSLQENGDDAGIGRMRILAGTIDVEEAEPEARQVAGGSLTPALRIHCSACRPRKATSGCGSAVSGNGTSSLAP